MNGKPTTKLIPCPDFEEYGLAQRLGEPFSPWVIDPKKIKQPSIKSRRRMDSDKIVQDKAEEVVLVEAKAEDAQGEEKSGSSSEVREGQAAASAGPGSSLAAGPSTSSTSTSGKKKATNPVKSNAKDTEEAGPSTGPKSKRAKKAPPRKLLPGVNIYQMKVTIKHSKPPIWRRILMEETATFEGLHFAIQGFMGWQNEHLYEFNGKGLRVRGKTPLGTYVSYGQDDEPRASPEEVVLRLMLRDQLFDQLGLDKHFVRERTVNDEDTKIKDHFQVGTHFTYKYDFGDDWDHDVVLEKIIPAEEDLDYPRCIAGKRDCPPEDCGGIYGFQDLLEILAKPKTDRTASEQNRLANFGIGAEDYDPAKYTPPKESLFFL